MFFILSKTLSYLVMPLTIVCVFMLLGVFIKNRIWRRAFAITGIFLLFVCSNEYVTNECMLAWEIKTKPYAEMRKYRVGIVLTGAVIPSLKPDDRVYFHKGADRVVHSVQLYKLGLLEHILVSGGSGRLIDIQEREADKFKDAMVLMGVPENDITIENETRNTHESAVEVNRMIDSLSIPAEDCLLITSAFHMRRSLACFAKVGLPLDSFTTDFYSHPRPYTIDAFFLPKIDALIISHKLVREWVGYAAYWLAGYV